ncbi:glycosyltransferase family 4 protein [Aquabacterium sp.]|uniref:glycosyltransferase family 4 protein n=1 Tax=Aquabacterium sp. TaxID=1872578 RepID=UPI0025C29970|nr:glycosyltransferase family 4 protein [Aquabacterium sp.]
MSKRQQPYIYLACPWAPMGGGMYKVVDYLIQAQTEGAGTADLRVLDTRGGGRAIFSPPILILAMFKVLFGRLSGRLVGLHVNMAERLSLFRKGALILLARALGLPVVLHLHAAQLHHFYRGLPGPLQWLVRWIFASASLVVVLGEQARRFVIEELGVPASQVEILINGVPGSKEPRRAFDPNGPFNILFLGNLMERKGVSDLLKALASPEMKARQSKWHARLAGGGDVEHYRALARTLGVPDNTEFVGWADQAKAAKLIAHADVLILPSYDEGLPLVILEALAKGVAVIATPVGEIPAVLTHGVDNWFVQPGDVQGIANAFCTLMDNPPLRITLETGGADIYTRKFSMDVFFRNVARIHQERFGFCASQSDRQQTS